MKNVYLSLAVLCAGIMSAQQSVPAITTPVKPQPTKQFQTDRTKLSGYSKVSPGAVVNSGSYWVNYGEAIDQVLGGGPGTIGPAELNWNYLNTDSALYGDFGGTQSAIWVHHLGDVLDVNSTYFNQIYGTVWDNTTAYNVDSIGMIYSYTRTQPEMDTLIVTLFSNQTAANMPTYYFTGMAADYGSDTLYFKAIKYTYASNAVNATGKVTYKFALGDLDSTQGAVGYWALPNPFSVAAGKKMGCAITFKPGFPYTLGDVADNKNAFYFASYEENGANTFPLYTYCPNSTSAACDWNSSHIVTTDVRYNVSSGWNGFFIPAYAYTDAFGFEHHGIYYHMNEGTVGQNEIANATPFAVEQNMPNPFDNSTVIAYRLMKAANSVKVEIVDFAGRAVISQFENNMQPGEYTITVDGSKLSKGVYFYSVDVDGFRITKKMIVD